MLLNILAITALAASALANPVPDASPASDSTPTSTSTRTPRPVSTVCVVLEGDPPVVIDPYPRPQCVCRCLKSTCEWLTDNQDDYIRCATTPWPSAENPWSSDLITYVGACTGSTFCVG